MKQENLIGQKFNHLIVIGRQDYIHPQNKRVFPRWLCKCDCGNTIVTTADSLIKGRKKTCGCKEYRGSKPKKSNKEFIKEVQKINNKITITGEYKGWDELVSYICNFCGYQGFIRGGKALQGQGCPKCAGKQLKSHKEFINEVKEKFPNIEVKSQYINSKTKVHCKCKIDGYEWDVEPSSLLVLKKGCIKCADLIKITNKEFLKEMETKRPDLTFLSEYKNAKTKIKYCCNVCGYKSSVLPNTLRKVTKCPNCAGVALKQHEKFIDELKEIQPSIEILSEYINCKTKIKCKCLNDGYIWSAIPNSLLKGTGCYLCSMSKGEKRIKDYLDLNNISYQTQKEFSNLYGISGGNLSYDFYLPDNNILIEYQGEQHEKPVDFNGFGITKAKIQFKKQQEHDKRKYDYSKNNGYNLLEIWYYDFNKIESILKAELEKKNKTSKVYTPTMGDEIKF